MALYTYFVYTLLLLGVFVLSSLISFKKNGRYITKYFGVISVLLIFFFSLIDGCRYKVGIDWLQYKNIFVHLQQTGNFSREKLEFFYKFINVLLAEAGLHYAFLFMLMSGMLILSLLVLLRNFREHLWCILPLFICWFLSYSDNLSRQFLAISLLFVSMYFFISKKYSYCVVFALLAQGCHVTVFAIVPVYLILYYVNFRKFKYFPLYLYGVCIIGAVIMTAVNVNILSSEYVSLFLTLINRESYIERISNAEFNSFDFSIYSRIVMGLLNLFILYQATKVKRIENWRLFNWIFNIYLIGICLWELLCTEELLQRYLFYSYCFFPLVWGIVLSKTIQKRNFLTSTIALLIIVYSIRRYFFFSTHYGFFNFIWDVQ